VRLKSKKREREDRLRSKLLKARRGPGPVWCEAHFPGCFGAATDGHEVHTSARGGSRVDMSNVVDLCRHCHMVITRSSGQTGWAIRHGWVVASWADARHLLDAAIVRNRFRCGFDCTKDHRETFA